MNTRQHHLTIEQSLRLHGQAMDASSCGITIADATLPDMPLIYVNDAFEAITGYPPTDTIGRNCRFLQKEDRDQPGLAILRSGLRSGESVRVELRNYRQDGKLFWNELFISPVVNEANVVTHLVGVQTDITGRKRAEAREAHKHAALEFSLRELRETQAMLMQAEKMNALGQMVAYIAHEINNPISFVNSNLHSLPSTLHTIIEAYDRLEKVTLAAPGISQTVTNEIAAIRKDSNLDFVLNEVDDLLAASVEGLHRVKKIVESLRTFARLEQAEYKHAHLKDCVAGALLVARGELKDRIEVVLDVDQVPEIYCYPAELNQAFFNVIVNATQAIPARGTLTIRAREAGEHVVIAFTDTGIGMTPDVVEQVFTPFFTTKPVSVGTGLGLAIVHKIIVDRHQGSIQVNSAPSQGTTITITLPKDSRR